MERELLLLVRSDQGDGGWSLHPRTDEDAAPDEMTVLASGTADWDADRGEWNRPNEEDFKAAMEVFRQKC